MNKVVFALRSIGLTIVGVVIAIIVTSSLVAFFSLFMESLPMEDLQAADWSGRSTIVERYMADNPFAVYTMLLSHALGAALAVYFSVRTAKVPSWSKETRIKPFTGALIILALWIWGDIQNDMVDVPIGIMWTSVDVLVTVLLSGLAFLIGGGLKKHSPPAAVTSEDTAYRG